jgi:hypothetical protein
MARIEARLLAYAPGRFLALAPHATLELLEAPRPVPVPGAAAHALGLLAWQGRHIPMIDLATVLGLAPPALAPTVPRYALVVAYQPTDRAAPAYGAIGLVALPRMEVLDDVDPCALPQDGLSWSRVAISCMRCDGEPVPIIDTGLLFAPAKARA